MPLPEDTYQAIYTPQHTAFYAPGFGSGTPGLPGQPTVPTDEDDDEAGPKRGQSSTTLRVPTSPLAGVNTGDRRGGSPYGGQTTPGSPGVVERDVDRYRRGTAPFTAENMGKLAGNVVGLTSGTGAVTTGAASIAETATGAEPGDYGGVQNFTDHVGPNPAGAANIKAGRATFAEQAAADRAAAGYGGVGGFGADSVGEARGTSESDPVGRSAADAARGTPGGGTSADASGEYRRGGTVLPSPTASAPGSAPTLSPQEIEALRGMIEQATRGTTSGPGRGIPPADRSEPNRYADGGTVGGGNRSGSGFNPANIRRPTAAPSPRGFGPTDGPMIPKGRMPISGKPSPYAEGGTVDMEQGQDGSFSAPNPTGDPRYMAPASIPNDGITDNVPIQADEGEFVLRRDAAVHYSPELLEILNDPELADDAAAALAEAFGLTIASATEEEMEERSTGEPMRGRGNAVSPERLGMRRPSSALGRIG